MHWAWSSVSAMGRPSEVGYTTPSTSIPARLMGGSSVVAGGGRHRARLAGDGSTAARGLPSRGRAAPGRGTGRSSSTRTSHAGHARAPAPGCGAGKDRPVRASPKPAADPTVVGIGRGRRRCSPLIPPSPAEGRRGRGRLRVGRQWGCRPASLARGVSEGAFFSAPQPLPGGRSLAPRGVGWLSSWSVSRRGRGAPARRGSAWATIVRVRAERRLRSFGRVRGGFKCLQAGLELCGPRIGNAAGFRLAPAGGGLFGGAGLGRARASVSRPWAAASSAIRASASSWVRRVSPVARSRRRSRRSPRASRSSRSSKPSTSLVTAAARLGSTVTADKGRYVPSSRHQP